MTFKVYILGQINMYVWGLTNYPLQKVLILNFFWWESAKIIEDLLVKLQKIFLQNVLLSFKTRYDFIVSFAFWKFRWQLWWWWWPFLNVTICFLLLPTSYLFHFCFSHSMCSESIFELHNQPLNYHVASVNFYCFSTQFNWLLNLFS